MLEVCWVFLLAWDVGHGFGCEVLWVQWLEYVMGWPALGGAMIKSPKIFYGKIGDSYSLKVATTAHVTFFLN